MITDIKKIKKELIGFEEIDTFSIKPYSRIKYITLKGNSESFYLGGELHRIMHNKVVLYNSGNTWAVPINIVDKNNNIIYTSRFFVQKNYEKDSSKIKELKQTIHLQQKIINKLKK